MKYILEYSELSSEEQQIYAPIRECVESLVRYVNHRIPTGGFLQAVLENNLMEAMARADLFNRHNLFLICQYIYNYLPHISKGSPKLVADWLNGENS